jgi:hypothetical protein
VEDMKSEKQIQDEVWEHISDNKTMKEMWSMPEIQDDIKYIIESVVTKTIELVINDIQEKLSKTDLINIKSYDEGYATGYVEGMGKGVHTEAYIEGYEAAVKELKSNVLKDSTAAIIHKNGYDEGYMTAVIDIQAKLAKTDTVNVKSYEDGYKEGCTEFAEKLSKFIDRETDAGDFLFHIIETTKKELTKT